MVDELLSRCVVAYVGTPGRVDARSPEERVLDCSGDDGCDLLPAVKMIVDAVYEADPPLHNFRTEGEIGDAVVGFLLERYPALSAEAVEVVANSFAFDYR